MQFQRVRMCALFTVYMYRKKNLPRKRGFEMRESRQPMTAAIIRHFL
jgi:hypothetical protein